MKTLFILLTVIMTLGLPAQNTPAKSPNPFRIELRQGLPCLTKNGMVVPPVFFWQKILENDDVNQAMAAGLEVFTCFCSWDYFDHPYWTGENQYDFSWYDAKIDAFFQAHPNAYLIPRIFVCAPYWWLEKHPEECIGFTNNPPRTRGYAGGSTLHESFASELWKTEQGEALRQLLRHFQEKPWGNRIVGIHIAGGTRGEWHCWSGGDDPDVSPAMQKRYGKPIPPAMERTADYFQCFYSAGADAINHFCKIVKEEGDYLTVVFYGYCMANLTPYSHHRALQLVLRSPYVDMLSAPHTYRRRNAGEDGYFRAFPATVAKHGKLFFDEADDRTHLVRAERIGGGMEYAKSIPEALHYLRREIGNAMTHCTGMWWMDIDHGCFRHPAYWEEFRRAYQWHQRQLALPQKRVSQVAVLCDEAGRQHLPMDLLLHPHAEFAARLLTLGALTHTGAPFDFFTTDDADFETLQKYRAIVVIDGVAPSPELCHTLKRLQNDHRALIWMHGSGSYRSDLRQWDLAQMKELTGMEFQMTSGQDIPWRVEEQHARTSPGFLPLECHKEFPNWSSWYFGNFEITAARLRPALKKAGVFLYTESDDVLSASYSALMLHASGDGEKLIRLPRKCTVTDMVTGKCLGTGIDQFRISMKKGETGLFELADTP